MGVGAWSCHWPPPHHNKQRRATIIAMTWIKVFFSCPCTLCNTGNIVAGHGSVSRRAIHEVPTPRHQAPFFVVHSLLLNHTHCEHAFWGTLGSRKASSPLRRWLPRQEVSPTSREYRHGSFVIAWDMVSLYIKGYCYTTLTCYWKGWRTRSKVVK